MTTRTKVFIPGKGEFTLTEADHLSSGGEGAVYAKKGYAIKLFHEPAKAQQRGLESKITMLSAIQHPFIVAPVGAVYDASHAFIGYYMPLAAGEPLVKTFTNVWRDASQFDDVMALKLVGNMRDAVRAAHSAGALLVDGNEFNYLAQGTDPRLIDVDSWQIGPHKATALMPSVRDHHSSTFTQGSDWFGWGVVSFQVLTGIHPYKGTHPDFKKSDLAGRMQANASVFEPKVRLNSAVRDFARIPGPLLDWYCDVFQKGGRNAPPASFVAAVSPTTPRRTRVVQSSGGTVRHEKLFSVPGVLRHIYPTGVLLYEGPKGLEGYDLHRRKRIIGLADDKATALAQNKACLIRSGLSHIYLSIAGNEIRGEALAVEGDPAVGSQPVTPLPLSAERLIVLDSRPFALSSADERGLIELKVDSFGSRFVTTVHTAWPVATRSARFYDGMAVMDCLGHPFIAVPFEGAVAIHRCPGLADHRPVGGFARHSGLVIVEAISRKDGVAYRLSLRLAGAQYEVEKVDVMDTPGLSAASNAKGVLVGIFEDGSLTVASALRDGERVVQDASITKDMVLFSLPDGIGYARDDSVYKISLSAGA